MPRLGSDQVIAAAFVDADAARPRDGHDCGGIERHQHNHGPRVATDDGGLTWIRGGTFTMNGVAADLQAGALDFVGREDGWFSLSSAALGSSTMDVFRTQNAGASWTHVVATSFMPAPGQSSDIPLGCDKNPAVFSDANTGWITASCNGGSPFLYVSHDGGVSWRSSLWPSSTPSTAIRPTHPQFVTSSTGFMIGIEGTATAPVVTLFVDHERWSDLVAVADTEQRARHSGLHRRRQWLAPHVRRRHLGSRFIAVGDAQRGKDMDGSRLEPAARGVSLDFLTTQIGWAFFSEWLEPLPAQSS